MSRKFNTIEERLDFIEFRQELLFGNTDIDRVLFKYEMTRDEYQKIIELMDKFGEKIVKGQSVNSAIFETELYRILPITPVRYGDYSMCELIAKGFANSKRWEEVYTILYGKFVDFEGVDID